MSSSAAEHVLLRLSRAPVIRQPFRHFYVREVFPRPLYDEIVAHLPDEAAFGAKRQYPRRRILDPREIGSPFWHELCAWMGDPAFIGPLFRKFAEVRAERFGRQKLRLGFDLRLVRDDPGYSLGPHTDTPEKFLSYLFYLPRIGVPESFGTTIFRPHIDGLKSDGTEWFKAKDFDPVWTAPFKANCCFGFARTNESWHGVLPTECPVMRDALLLNIYAAPEC